MAEKITRLDYCQFLLVSPVNYTLTYFADHSPGFSHDQINRYLRDEKMSPRLLWDNVRDEIVMSKNGYIVFDDTVVDKNHSHCIELVRRQWSGNTSRRDQSPEGLILLQSVIKGIGVVTCVYVNPQLNQFWAVDYRLYAPDCDGKSKLDHVKDMLMNLVHHKELAFSTILMDSWYASRQLMLTIERFGKLYSCPIKANRLVDESHGDQPHQRVDSLTWSDSNEQQGKVVHLKNFPKGHRVKLFRLVLSTKRTDAERSPSPRGRLLCYVVTNNLAQDSAAAVQQESSCRWKIEQFHRESKQLTGLERCQCRTGRIQRNHIAAAMLVWAKLKQMAIKTCQTIYQVKYGLISDYMIEQLRNPTIQMTLA